MLQFPHDNSLSVAKDSQIWKHRAFDIHKNELGLCTSLFSLCVEVPAPGFSRSTGMVAGG
jgi:hypothetical protein